MMDNNNSECPGDIESQDVSDVQALASPMVRISGVTVRW